MSKQAIIELLNSNALKYQKAHSSKAKGEQIKQLMELTGYKSSKNIIRYYSRIRKRKRVEKRGRLPKLQLNDIELIKTIWLKSDQPCGAFCKRARRHAAGFHHWVPDVLRHTFASYHLRYFRSYSELQYETGHRDSSLLRTRYVSMRRVGDAACFRF